MGEHRTAVFYFSVKQYLPQQLLETECSTEGLAPDSESCGLPIRDDMASNTTMTVFISFLL